MNLNDYEDWDELEEKLLRNQKRKQNVKRKKNKDDKDFYESQGLPPTWRKGDSYIGRQKKRRNKNQWPIRCRVGCTEFLR